jgi:hypothetical protein
MQNEHIAVSMGWRLPDESRLRVTYSSRVVAYEEDKDRWLVVLENVLPDATNPDGLANTDAVTRNLVASLAGKWAYVPEAARAGITLPLKYETLTGRIRFFYAGDPREEAGSKRQETRSQRQETSGRNGISANDV